MRLISWLFVPAWAALVGCGDKDDGATPGDVGSTVDADGDGYGADVDCDDSSASVAPGAEEVCDGLDNDCDGVIDEDPVVGVDLWEDADGDGFGDPDAAVVVCEAGAGLADNDDDCDDDDAGVHPDAQEVCDAAEVDEDCDGLVNGADDSLSAEGLPVWSPDADGDGFGDAAAEPVAACEEPTGEGTTWVLDATDCDDADATIHPDAQEVCDEADTDEDCDGDADDADGSVDRSTGEAWAPDGDGDGFGDAGHPGRAACDDPSTEGDAWVLDATDCDDGDAAVNPGATEICDEADTDEDCSGAADDADPDVDLTAGSDWYPDGDADGYGDAGIAASRACDDPSGVTTFLLDHTDCDDTDPAVNPGATEVCDADDTDEDCSGAADDDDPYVDSAGQTFWYTDRDNDGYGSTNLSSVYVGCDDPSDASLAFSANADDCDDAEPDVNPGATEVCDADDTDEDCSGAADDADSGVDTSTFEDWTVDADGDGYGDSAASVAFTQCDDPSTAGTTYMADATDCDDGDAAVNPGATEVCDADDTDEDCDGDVDDADTSVDLSGASDWYVDDDLDGYGDEGATPVAACDDPSGATTTFVDDDSDCDDGDADINPGATEIYGDGTDQTCDGDDVRTFTCTGYSVPGSYATISAASAALGDSAAVQTICLSAGTYTETPTLRGNLRVIGPSAGQTTINGHVRVVSGRDGATVDVQGVTINGGVELDGGATSVEWTTTFSDVVIDGDRRDGVHLNRDGSGTPHTTIERSVVYGGTASSAVYLYDYGYNDTDRVRLIVRDSYLYDGSYGLRTAVTRSSSRRTYQAVTVVGSTIEGANYGIFAVGRFTNFTLRNNAIVNNSRGFAWTGGGNMTNDYNLYYGNTTNFYDAATGGSNRVTTDPGFSSDVPPAPTAGMAADGAGTTSGASSTDYWGNARPSPPSIGAVERF